MARTPRPLIGINADFIASGKNTRAHARLNAGYFDSLYTAGALPVIMPPAGSETLLDAYLDRLDGVLLSGGLDLDPRRQQQPPHPAVLPMSERRELSDRILVRRAVARQVPLLAIGVGMLLLNDHLGGTHYLHLPQDLPRALPHRDALGGPHRHAVLIEPKTRLAEIYGGGEIRVNSSHHQAVRQLGSDLRVCAVAPDGVIEAVETTDPDWFCIGVQWHPESETSSALDRQLFDSFVQACASQAQPLRLAA
jgi:putative glutamine amidotransferase